MRNVAFMLKHFRWMYLFFHVKKRQVVLYNKREKFKVIMLVIRNFQR